MADNTVLPGRCYRHFKGNVYKVIGIAVHTETGEQMVVYQAQYGEHMLFVRPLSMFIEPIDGTKNPDIKQRFRFELIDEKT